MRSERRAAETSKSQKITLYIAEDILEETRAEARRLERSISWVMQSAWRHAREALQEMPGTTDQF